jgi:hypothetical protein
MASPSGRPEKTIRETIAIIAIAEEAIIVVPERSGL